MCVHVRSVVRKQYSNYYDYIIIIFEVLMYTVFVDLVKRGVLTHVGEIWRDKNDRYYYFTKQCTEFN